MFALNGGIKPGEPNTLANRLILCLLRYTNECIPINK